MTINDTASDHRFLVLHAIRLKGTADVAVASLVSGLDASEVDAIAGHAAASDLLSRKEGRISGFRLTETGRVEHERLLTMDTSNGARRAGIEAAYSSFLPLNSRLKDICGMWQMKDGAPNDHQDSEYDATVIDKLAELNAEAEAGLRTAGESSERMAVYADRLNHALSRVQAGEVAAFARPMAHSYHDAWMELHQDLLLSLGRERDEADGH